MQLDLVSRAVQYMQGYFNTKKKSVDPGLCNTAQPLTHKKPDEVRVVLGKKVIQIPEAGEGAFIVFGTKPIHGYRLSVWCLKLKEFSFRNISRYKFI